MVKSLPPLHDVAAMAGLDLPKFLGDANVSDEGGRQRAVAAAEINGEISHFLETGLAHIIDMHQLTKDPERLLTPEQGTPSSPSRTFTKFELARYLDYCSEMLSVISKVAALYVQNFDDPVTLAAVNDVEQLTGSLSQKLWLKIDILERVAPAAARAAF